MKSRSEFLSNPIKSGERRLLSDEDLKAKMTGARLRKIVSHIRVSGKLPIIATSKGYYVSYDAEEIRNQVKSLEERAARILAAANGIRCFLPEVTKKDDN